MMQAGKEEAVLLIKPRKILEMLCKGFKQQTTITEAVMATRSQISISSMVIPKGTRPL